MKLVFDIIVWVFAVIGLLLTAAMTVAGIHVYRNDPEILAKRAEKKEAKARKKADKQAAKAQRKANKEAIKDDEDYFKRNGCRRPAPKVVAVEDENGQFVNVPQPS